MKDALALLINDIHISKDNISEFNLNWNEALDICKEYQIHDIIIGGDLFTSRSSQTLSVLLAVKEALQKASNNGLYITIAPGNHDRPNLHALESYVDLYNSLKKVEVVQEWKYLVWGGCDWALLLMAYFPENDVLPIKIEEALKSLKSDFADTKVGDIILYCHAGIHGALGNLDIPGEAPQELFMDFKKVLAGHYHNRCRIKNTPIEYIGSSRQHNFGEDDEKGYTILYSDGSTEFIQNQINTRFKTFILNADKVDEFELLKDPLYKYKVQVNCTEKQTKLFDKQKWLEKGFDKVEVIAQSAKDTSSDSSAITEKYDKLGIKKEYQNYCEENSIDSRLGIKYLEGQNYVEIN